MEWEISSAYSKIQTLSLLIAHLLVACQLTEVVSQTECLNSASQNSSADTELEQSRVCGIQAYKGGELGSVLLSWNGSAPYYQIQYKEYSEPHFQNISSDITGNEFNITSTLLPGVSYYIKALAFDKAAGSIIGSDQVLHTTKPRTVTFLDGIVGSDFISFLWAFQLEGRGDYIVDFNTTLQGGPIYWLTDEHTSSYKKEEGPNGTIYSQTFLSLRPDTEYGLRVAANIKPKAGKLEYVQSDWSVKHLTTEQGRLYGVQAYNGGELGSVLLSWNGTASYYQIQFKEYSEPEFQNISSEITGHEFNITSSLLSGVSYFIKVLAFDKAAGSIIGSDQVMRTTKPRAVRFLRARVGSVSVTLEWKFQLEGRGDYIVDFSTKVTRGGPLNWRTLNTSSYETDGWSSSKRYVQQDWKVYCSTVPPAYSPLCEAGRTMPGKREILPDDKFSYQPLKRVSASLQRSESRNGGNSYGSWELVPYYKRELWNSLGIQAPAQPDRDRFMTIDGVPLDPLRRRPRAIIDIKGQYRQRYWSLDPATEYEFHVAAKVRPRYKQLEYVQSDWSVKRLTTEEQSPDPVRDLVIANVNSSSMIVSWLPPANQRGTVVDYVVGVYQDGTCVRSGYLSCSNCQRKHSTYKTSSYLCGEEQKKGTFHKDSNTQIKFSYPIMNLTAFTEYDVYVRAFNTKEPSVTIGGGITSEIAPTEAPVVTVGRPKNTSIPINWRAVNGDSIGTIRGYRVSILQSSFNRSINVAADNLDYTFRRLTPSTKYEIRVSAYTSAGDGPYEAVFGTTEKSPEHANVTKESMAKNSMANERVKESTIIVAAIVPSITILAAVAIICYACRRQRCFEEKDMASGAEGCSILPSQICEELRHKLKSMYIDPNSLSYNPSCDLIGKGSFGNVYLGQLQTKQDRLRSVAIKTLKETDEIGIHQVEEFLAEACFSQLHNHVNILIALGVVWKKGCRPLAVLPYMAHGDLRSLVRKKHLDLTIGDLLHFGFQVATGMEYLTTNRYLHRDLAARNCLVDDSYLVKIADFGMSRDIYSENYYRESSRDKPKPVKWMAMESLEEGVHNSRTEVWSFGVLMWELLSHGSMPYPEVSNREILPYLMSGHRLDKPFYISDDVFNEIARCWHVNPALRPSFIELCEFLEMSYDTVDETRIDELDGSGETFVYSYVRNFTKHIPSDYSSVGAYVEILQDIVYVEDAELWETEEMESSESLLPAIRSASELTIEAEDSDSTEDDNFQICLSKFEEEYDKCIRLHLQDIDTNTTGV